jgi:hypothetical protein
MLYNVCASLYPKMPGSRLTAASNNERDETHYELTNAIRNFLRWCGAPWCGSFSGSVAAEPVAARLHSTFLMVHVNRTYLAPLDRLGLGEPANHSERELRQVRFGNAEIVLMEDEFINYHLEVEALQRFGDRCALPTERLKDFIILLSILLNPQVRYGSAVTVVKCHGGTRLRAYPCLN